MNPFEALRGLWKLGAIILVLVFAIGLGIGKANAQVTGTFTAAPNNGNAPFATTLTWNVQGITGTTCVASGSWAGSKPLVGSQPITGLLSNASYVLTCTTPAIPAFVDTATISWQPVTQNTDNTPVTNLAGYRILFGTSPTSLTQMVQAAGAGLTGYTVEIAANPGTYYFAVRAYSSTGAESANSNVASKVMNPSPVVAPFAKTFTVPVTVAPQPKPPLITIDATAYKGDFGNKDQAKVKVVGTVPLQTPCILTLSPYSGEPVDLLGLNLVPQSKLTLSSGKKCTSTAVAGCPLQVWAKCATNLEG